MSDSLTATFCERCGTRQEFRAPSGLGPLRKTRGFIGGLRTYIGGSDALSEAMREGIELTLRQLKAAFAKGNLKEIDPAGQKFDPHFHQAISVAPAEGVAPNHVAAVLQKGWLIADRVLRPALVTVAQA